MKYRIFIHGILPSAICYNYVLSDCKRGITGFPLIIPRPLGNCHKPLTAVIGAKCSKFIQKSIQELLNYQILKSISLLSSRLLTHCKTSSKFTILLHRWRNELIPSGELGIDNNRDAFVGVCIVLLNRKRLLVEGLQYWLHSMFKSGYFTRIKVA